MMEERLERVLNRVIDWLKYEEAKNGALIALNGVAMSVIVPWLSNAPQAASPWLKASVVTLLVSIMIALISFYPVLNGDKLQRNATRRQATMSKPNLLFFADIAGDDPKTYIKKLHDAEANGGTQLELDYAREIVENAEIAVFKLGLFKMAFVVSFLAFILTVVAAIVHL
jgi:hypothetical protein